MLIVSKPSASETKVWIIIFSLNDPFSEKYCPGHSPDMYKFTRILDIFIVLTLAGFGISMTQTWMISFFLPELPLFLRSWLPASPTGILWLIIPFVHLVDFYILLIIYLNMSHLILILALFGGYFLPFVLQELRTGMPNYKSETKLRSQPENLIIAYRSAYILHERQMLAVEMLFIPIDSISHYYVVYAISCLLGFSKNLSLTTVVFTGYWACTVFFIWASVLFIGGRLQINGMKVLDSWKRKSIWCSRYDKILMRKFRKSCKPMIIHCSGTYKIGKLRLLKYCKGISRNLLRSFLILLKSR